ncbi:helix-turn-helix domain-containing protein [Streptomyces sp. WMMC940]|uniref:helix-turn-helix domain-containing protein n=1 Tax=Streptomyces sp. WMMC940 TaxID=3015153 RepID=UPI0022B60728|nr:helix-turn-helix transcriptional regulator [Streptomyces sp. WMMC940]MCZ7458822.1 helix-turn-helix transcriptional regulator [Streptomyces sp. WMMC940]
MPRRNAPATGRGNAPSCSSAGIPLTKRLNSGWSRYAGSPGPLTALFERTGRQGKPLGESAADAAAVTGHSLTAPERTVLDVLTAGLTDEAIARRLVVSVRTTRCVTADLMQRLGARSRFEAGVLATGEGWVSV